MENNLGAASSQPGQFESVLWSPALVHQVLESYALSCRTQCIRWPTNAYHRATFRRLPQGPSASASSPQSKQPKKCTNLETPVVIGVRGGCFGESLRLVDRVVQRPTPHVSHAPHGLHIQLAHCRAGRRTGQLLLSRMGRRTQLLSLRTGGLLTNLPTHEPSPPI
jgi:hypothetical protein